MRLKRTNPFTGEVNFMELPITPEQYEEAYTNWRRGMYIQDAFPMLNADEREFIKTGITPDYWNKMFGSAEE
jgi:hypothetical protein